MVVATDLWFEAYRTKRVEPRVPAEQAFHVPVVNYSRVLAVAQQVRVVDEVSRVCRIGIPDPLHVTQRAVLSIVSTVFCGGCEGFAREVRADERDAARPAVHVGGFHRAMQV